MPRHDRPPVRIGPDPASTSAAAVVVAVHGRDQSAGWIVEHLVDPLTDLGEGISWILPRADDRSWYAGRAADPVSDHADEVEAAVDAVIGAAWGIDRSRSVLVGFSQGGCVVAESLASDPAGWGGAAILTGRLLGPDPGARSVAGPLEGRPVWFGLGEPDPWMDVAAARATCDVFAAAGAHTDLVVTPSTDHTVHDADLDLVRRLVARVVDPNPGGST